jgi:N6-adenosine-specific RNA methylase IME4
LRRRNNLTWGHHREVAPLEPPEQDEWLNEAENNRWSVHELRKALRKRGSATPDLPGTRYGCIVADPPWDVLTGPIHATGGVARVLTYPTMSVEEIAALPIQELAADDAHLYLWTVNAYLPDVYEVAKAWGFEPSTLLVWCKSPNGLGLGGTFSLTTEYVLFARRGSHEAKQRIDATAFHWKRGRHSAKPPEFFELTESVSEGPYLELFARTERAGWDVWGNEVADVAA